MNTVKWRRLSIAAAFAVAGSVLFAVIVAVSPDAAEAGRSGSDTTPPGRSDGSPTGTLPAGTTSATLSLTTDEAATCRYSTTAGVAYSRMKDTVWTVGYANNPDGPQHSIQTLALHWDGSAWSIVATPNAPMDWNRLYGVAATASNDVWAVGTSQDVAYVPLQTLIEHWDGTAWSIVPSPSPGAVVNDLRAVSALSGNDAWAVGFCAGWYRSSTLILHWDGGSWSRVPSPNPNAGFASNELYGIATFSPDDIWAVGVSGNSTHPYAPLALHWDGASWSAISTDGLGGGAYGSFFRSVSGTSSGDMLAVGATVFDAGFERGIRHVAFAAHWDGATWTQITDFTFVDPGEYYSSTNFYGVSMVASDFGWVVGEASGDAWLFHWDGTSLNEVAASDLPWYNTLYAVDALSRDVAWAAGRYAIEGLSGTKTLTEMYSVS